MRNDNTTIATTDGSTTSMEDTDSSFVNVANSNNAVSLSVRPKHTVIGVDAAGQTTTEICVTMNAAELQDDEQRAAVDIIVALDVSGSMSGAPLKLCKRTLEMLLRVLLPNDRFGLVTYASDAVVDIPIQKMTPANKQAALQKIESLCTRGATNISAAIGLAAMEMNAVGHEPNEVRSIFLLTDGLANEGIRDVPGLVKLTQNCLVNGVAAVPNRGLLGRTKNKTISTNAEKLPGPPISMHCFGYGTNHNAELLRQVALAASGSYYFVENDTNVGSAFGDCLGGVLSVVAQSAVVMIQPCQEALDLGMKIFTVHHDQSIQRDNGSYTVTVGDFYAEESRDVLLTVQLATAKTPNATPIPHVSVHLSYTDTLRKRPVTTETVTCSIARPAGSEVSTADTHVAAQWLRVFATREMALADTMAQGNDLMGAQAKIRLVRDKIQEECEGVQICGEIRELCIDMETVEDGLQSREVWHSSGSKHMASSRMTHGHQRAATSAGGANVYMNKQKKKLSAGFNLAGRNS
jgi:Mg-chelatase subunit ChlD